MASVHVLVRASPHILDVIPKNFGKLPGVDNRCLNCMKEASKIDPDNTATDGKGICFTSDSLPGVMAPQQQKRAVCRTMATARMCCLLVYSLSDAMYGREALRQRCVNKVEHLGRGAQWISWFQPSEAGPGFACVWCFLLALPAASV